MALTEQLMKEKIVAVIRADSMEEGYELAKAIIEGGIKAIEITFTIPDAFKLIKRLNDTYKDQILLGAGTVLDLSSCKIAIDNGAKFIVAPGFEDHCAKYCYERNIPYMPGCMTVTEMLNARKHHVEVIKLFPGDHFGPKFIKNIKAPLPKLKVMVTGGVDLDNLKEWFKYGADMVGIGSALTNQKNSNDYLMVTKKAKEYKNALKDVA
ncbi:MAG: bifunctional 2-keto-4-hydroxyglutarate aldolase/2-keto-3-deoxy-6-phosphogluconate aldolase [Candidatus Izemoplasmataceae bacterium]